MPLELGEHHCRIVTRQMPELKIKNALVRHDVKRCAAMNDARMHCRMCDIEAPVIGTAVTISRAISRNAMASAAA